MPGNWVLILLLILPVLLAAAGWLCTSAEAAIVFCAVGTLAIAAVSAPAIATVLTTCHPLAAGKWFTMDCLSAFHTGIMMLVFSLSAVYAIGYFRNELRRSGFKRKTARRYTALWFGSLGAMMLVLLSNNIVVMWVGIEATTILTAFLICIHVTPASLEAMWKYLLMCSVGVAMAFIGTLLVAAATTGTGMHDTSALLWTDLMAGASKLNPTFVKAGFIFIIVGYGTKAGLAPMHNWLPDAHSQAPAPVSAIFSGFLLNTALFCILKFMPLVEAATGHTGWARDILILLGILSLIVSAIFIPAQHDVKRLLAYCSVEHIGIIAIGAGLGGIGCFAALLHTLNHSLGKTFSFFCAGRLGQAYRTHDMRLMTGVLSSSPVWGAGLVASMLALVGAAPFSLFVSEFLILKSAYDSGSYAVMTLMLTALAVIFISILRNIITMAWQTAADQPEKTEPSVSDLVFVSVMTAAILPLGLWIPLQLESIITRAASILGASV